MVIEDIEDEIYSFDDNYFNDYISVIDKEMEFLEKHSLECPKENYLLLYDFLTSTIVNFKNIDYMTVDSTLKKLYLDVTYLHKLYVKMNDLKDNVQDVFEKKFLPTSEIFRNYNVELQRLKTLGSSSIQDINDFKRMKRALNSLKEIYYENFVQIFLEDKKNFYNDLIEILNTKLYYIDKIMWLEVKNSDAVQRHLRSLKMTRNYSSKNYISHKLNVIMPYSQEYKYLKKCLRVYK